MQSVPPHGAKPQVVLMSSLMVQISHRATSCMSVLKTTLQCSLSGGRDNPATKWQCCSSDDGAAEQSTESGTRGSTFMLYMCDYNMFNVY